MPRPIREVRLGSLGVSLEQNADGSMLVRSTEKLESYPDRLTDWLEYWAVAAPDRTFLAQRDNGGAWRRVSYADTLMQIRSLATALVAHGLTAERPLAILSGNDIEHAMLALAAMFVGIPYAPISPAYSLISSDYGKLRYIVGKLTPGAVFVSDAGRYSAAIAAAIGVDMELIATIGAAANRGTTSFASLVNTPVSPAIDAIHVQVRPETIGKILFTSGSTGIPKGVINTQRMLCANQVMVRHSLSFVIDEPPVLIDWLPWHHTFGGNHNFGLVLANGGSLYIDEGKPMPGAFETTVANLRDIAPTIYFNVPKGFEALVVSLRNDPILREMFFSRLRLTYYAGAGLSPRVVKELNDLAFETTGECILMVSSLGSTETAPSALACGRKTAKLGVVGVPLPGLQMKLVPTNGKLEARLKGPSITPGYWRDAEQTKKAFDSDGFYHLGDALKFAEGNDASKGFVFDGRISEDFKLATGTWVSVGPLRARFLSEFAPLVRDVVIAGHDRDDVTALVFPDVEACLAHLAMSSGDAVVQGIFDQTKLRCEFQSRLDRLAKTSTGSSTRIMRILLLDDPPSIDASEITDKGSINQRAVLLRRASLVDELYANKSSSRIIGVS
jgi:feruloyl-CoA synthase